jgi:hypothetical protein
MSALWFGMQCPHEFADEAMFIAIFGAIAAAMIYYVAEGIGSNHGDYGVRP